MLEPLFEKWKLGDMTVKNRLSTLPMEGNDATPGGAPTASTLARYRQLAAGGWGIVYVEAVAPDERGKARPGQMILSPRNLDGFKQLIETMKTSHPAPPAVIFQINHAGRYGLTPTLPYHHELLDPTWDIGPDTPVATTSELEEAADNSARAVELAKRAGADGVDLKCCHGYLNIELARPANSRTDSFGGAFDNRMRFFSRLIRTAQSLAGDDFFFGSRISLTECFPGGLGSGMKEGLHFEPGGDLPRIMRQLTDAGAAFVCESMGIPYLEPDYVRPHARFEKIDEALALHHRLAAWAKECSPRLPVIGAGYTPLKKDFVTRAVENIKAGRVDAIGLGRQSFADPETPRKLMCDDTDRVNWCIGCKTNNCSYLLRNKVKTGCVIYDKCYKDVLKRLKAARKSHDETAGSSVQ